MARNILSKENIPTGTKHDVPTVTIIMPFEDVMSTKGKLELNLKKLARLAEVELMKHFTAEQAFPVISKLQSLIHEINYNTHKKSLAIFVSPLANQVFYLDFAVEEKMVVDESFEIRDLVLNKKETIQYLVLLLNEQRSKMYLGNCSELQLIKSNSNDDISTCKINVTEKVPGISDPCNPGEVVFNSFLYNMDHGLSLILKAYNLPVIIIASRNIISRFKKITKNVAKVVAFIEEDNIEATGMEIQKVLLPYLHDWKNLKQKKNIQEVENAMNGCKLSFGIQNVWSALTCKNCRLLVIEKDFVYHAYFVKNNDEYNQYKSEIKTPFYIKDLVDDVIEKVLKNGGGVEFVDDLENYDHIALLEH